MHVAVGNPAKPRLFSIPQWQPVVGPNTLVITYTSAGGQTTEYTITVDAQGDATSLRDRNRSAIDLTTHALVPVCG